MVEGRGVEVRPGVFGSSFSLVALRGAAVADDSLSSAFSFFVSDACTDLRRGDLNGLESVDVACSRRRRFPAELREVIVDCGYYGQCVT